MHKVSSRDCLPTGGVWYHFFDFIAKPNVLNFLFRTSSSYQHLFSCLKLALYVPQLPGQVPFEILSWWAWGSGRCRQSHQADCELGLSDLHFSFRWLPQLGAFPTCWGALLSRFNFQSLHLAGVQKPSN